MTSPRMIDLHSAEFLEISIDWDGKKVWINGPDGCVFRAYRVEKLILDDRRIALTEETDL